MSRVGPRARRAERGGRERASGREGSDSKYFGLAVKTSEWRRRRCVGSVDAKADDGARLESRWQLSFVRTSTLMVFTSDAALLTADSMEHE